MQHATLTGRDSTGRTRNGGYLFGGEFFLFHSDRVRKYRPRNSSILDTTHISRCLSEDRRVSIGVRLIQSCKTTLRRELWTRMGALYWMKRSALNLFVKS